MENNEPFEPYNTFHPLDAQATGLTILEMNEGVSNGWATGWPINGDAEAREAACQLRARLHSIVATQVGPGTYEIRA